MARERGKDGLRREQVDDGEERRERDDEEAKERAGGVAVRLGVRGGDGVGHIGHGLAPREARKKSGCDGLWGREDVTSEGEGRDYMFLSLASFSRSAEMSTAVLSPRFFHQWETSGVSATTSPALCTMGAEQLLAYSTISPSMM
jgi:hypothetical protein